MRRLMVPAVTLTVLSAVFMTSIALGAQSRDAIGGAWEQTSEKNLMTGTTAAAPNPPLHLIYLDGQYVQFAAAAGRPKLNEPIDAASLTKDQLLQRSGAGRLQGQYGTYRISGNTLTRTPISAAAPENEERQTYKRLRSPSRGLRPGAR